MATWSNSKTQTTHKALIEQLVSANPGMETRGFWKAVKKLTEPLDAFGEGVVKRSFLPDAYRIDEASETVEIHEVVNTHYPKRRALLAMGMFWFEFDSLDYGEWMPRLFIHREGCSQPAEVDLMYWYYTNMDEDISRKQGQYLNSELRLLADAQAFA